MTNEEAIKNVTYMRDSLDPLSERKLIESLDRAIEALSEQPIHCKDCKHMKIDNIYHNYWCNGKKVFLNHYCSLAERRADDER